MAAIELRFTRTSEEITSVLVEPMGFESTHCMETKEFCGAAWPSKVLKGKRGYRWCPLNAPQEIHSESRRHFICAGRSHSVVRREHLVDLREFEWVARPSGVSTCTHPDV